MKFAPNFFVQIKNSLSMLGLGMGIFAGYSTYQGDAHFYHRVLMPISRLIPPENAHRMAVWMAAHNLYPRYSNQLYPELKTTVFGLTFAHPVGLAAGFDKQAHAVLGLLDSGFSHVEVGSVTPLPQEGNPRPRVFRLPADEAVINRYGFNSEGQDEVYKRLSNIDWKGKGVVGVNLGMNKTSTDPAGDYVLGVQKFGEIADYLVINVSSPNTPGLRSLQKKEVLKNLLEEVVAARDKLNKRTPLLLKISPDETDEDLQDICQIVSHPKSGVDGLVVANTTVARPTALVSSSDLVTEQGGLSGRPLALRSTAMIARVSALTKGRLPIVGVGGVASGADAWAKIAAGATLVQLYSAMVYHGPPIAHKVVHELRMERLNHLPDGAGQPINATD